MTWRVVEASPFLYVSAVFMEDMPEEQRRPLGWIGWALVAASLTLCVVRDYLPATGRFAGR